MTRTKCNFCSQACFRLWENKKQFYSCSNCGKQIKRKNSERKKVINVFCSRSCAATYNNTHKKHGTRRSKLEVYLEEQIRKTYPDLEFLCNDKTAINSELDFYFPSLNFAIELNGIFHYEPVYGEDKLKQIQGNDERKFLLCHQAGISLAIVDSSAQKYFTQKTSEKYWKITNLLLERRKMEVTISSCGLSTTTLLSR